MEYIIYGWLGALILFLVIEIATTSLTTIWFAGGTVVALILNLCKAPFAAQAVSSGARKNLLKTSSAV